MSCERKLALGLRATGTPYELDRQSRQTLCACVPVAHMHAPRVCVGGIPGSSPVPDLVNGCFAQIVWTKDSSRYRCIEHRATVLPEAPQTDAAKH
jgi:hypothetical protein